MNSIELSLFVNQLQSVCVEMGATLRRAAFSPNIKDRLDYSCAIFNADGGLVAQAAHIPVHLGSMAYAMRDVVRSIIWAPGDMIIVNDPYLGGTHLPDVTLIAPLFVADELIAFVANRAHHADIGCERPGSMPLARTLAEEGLVIAPRHFLRGGVSDPATAALLQAGLRNPAATLGDFAAQVSANRIGLERLAALVTSHTTTSFAIALEALNAYAERLARATVAALPDGSYAATDFMDGDGLGADHIRIAVRIDIHGETATVDFNGTAGIVGGNINCPVSVTAAAAYYVFYALMPADTPPCAGSLSVLQLKLPERCLLNSQAPAAVAAGNVETSQRIVDVMLAALAHAIPARIPAAAQGTMNNIAMGGHDWEYYETIAGGTGAHAGGCGLDARHSHMTNTLNTPVEVLEMNFPLRVHRYAIRRGSGGDGANRGGDGVIREYGFLETTQVTLLGERRVLSPPGLAGGGAGQVGSNQLNGHAVAGKCELELRRGDRLMLATPGGGGWGTPGAAPDV